VGYGQRVYANSSTISTDVDRGCLLVVCGAVTNYDYPVTMSRILNGQPSTITAPLALSSAKHNIRFTGANSLPAPHAPVMVKIKTNSSLLSLINSISIQRTNNGVNEEVGDSYTVGTLLDLLGNGSGSNDELTVILPVPVPTRLNNGIQVSVEGVINLGRSADLFYAFYITPPETPSTVTACEGAPVNIAISNYDEAIEDQGYPYTYQLYTDSLTGDSIENISFSNGILTLPDTLSAKEYYLEARENGIYPSARTKITLIRNEPPSISLTTTTVSVCQEDNSVDLSYTGVTNTPISYTIDWDALAEAAGFIDIANALHAFSSDGGEISVSIPPGAEEGSYEGILTIENANGCTSTAYSISVNVVPKPAAPNLNIEPHSQY